MLKKIVSVGRVEWIKGKAGKDNCCWYYFDKDNKEQTQFLVDNMKQKKLEKGSVWEKADANGDGVVTDQEMAMRAYGSFGKQVRRSTKILVWFSALTATVFIVVLMTPLIDMERIDPCLALLKYGYLVTWVLLVVS